MRDLGAARAFFIKAGKKILRERELRGGVIIL